MRFRHSLLLALCLAVSIDGAAVAAGDGAPSQRALRLWEQLDTRKLKLRSESALVVDRFGNTLYARAADAPKPIASLTKLMTAMVILDGRQPLDEIITITKADRDLRRMSGSRLGFGARLTRGQMLTLALMSSENRAAAALARTYPGGTERFVEIMNKKAKLLGMHESTFVDPAGLDAGNTATARDLARLTFSALRYPAIREATTRREMAVKPYAKRGALRYVNSNRLVRNKHWDIQVSKTGYINEAGRCLVMHTNFKGTPTVVVLLNSYGKLTPFGDANRVRKWIEQGVDRRRGQRAALSKRHSSADSSAPG